MLYHRENFETKKAFHVIVDNRKNLNNPLSPTQKNNYLASSREAAKQDISKSRTLGWGEKEEEKNEIFSSFEIGAVTLL